MEAKHGRWLMKHSQHSGSTLAWKAEMKYCHRNTNTLCLSTLLGNGWLSDDHINMMMEELSQEAQNNAAMKTTALKKGKGELKKAMKAFRKPEKVEDKM